MDRLIPYCLGVDLSLPVRATARDWEKVRNGKFKDAPLSANALRRMNLYINNHGVLRFGSPVVQGEMQEQSDETGQAISTIHFYRRS